LKSWASSSEDQNFDNDNSALTSQFDQLSHSSSSSRFNNYNHHHHHHQDHTDNDFVHHELKELSEIRKSIQSDITERSRCIHDLNDVIYDMDSRLAARVWERDGGM
jgi:predicted  nucleic acid-binding Zn-ribbon protein